MPLLATGRALLDPDHILDELHTEDAVFADLACGGHGHFVLPASRRATSSGRVLAVDLSMQALGALRSRLSDYPHENIELFQGDLETVGGVPLADGEVDVALFANVFPSLSSPYIAVQEVRRILKPGGRFAVIGPKPSSPFFGLANRKEMSEDTVHSFVEDLGMLMERRFDAGAQHWCLVFRRAD